MTCDDQDLVNARNARIDDDVGHIVEMYYISEKTLG
jgi:hypothetical protein